MHDFNDLAILARVAHRLNFELAARDLGISASTVSRRIAALEARLGVPLVVRTTRSVRLTPAGIAYAQHCEEMVSAAQRADAFARTHLDGMQGDLSISAPLLFGRLVLAPIVLEFTASHPAVRIRLSLANARVDLAVDGFDLVIRTGIMPDSSLRARRLATAPFAVIASRECLARHGKPATLTEAALLPCIALDRGDERYGWSCGGSAEAIAVNAVFVSNDFEILREAALGSVGFALLPRFTVARDIVEGRLIELPIAAELEPAPVWLVFPGHKVPNRCASALADVVQSAVARDPSWRRGAT